MKDPLSFLKGVMLQTGGRFYFKLGLKKIYVFTDPEDIKKVFVDYRDYLGKSNVRQSFGNSNLTSEGDVWNRMFRYSRTFFVKNNLEKLIPLIHNEIENHVLSLKKEKNFLLQKELFHLINTLVVKLFYTGETEKSVAIPELNKSIDIIAKHITIETALPFKVPAWLSYPGKKNYLNVQSHFHHFIDEMTSKKSDQEENTLLWHIMKDPDITPDEVRIQALTFYMAGFETTANALFWTVKLILEDPKVVEKLKEELSSVNLCELDSFEKLEKLNYVNACLSEGLRLFPPAWFRTREVKEEFLFEGKTKITKNAHVVVSPYLTQRNELYFKEAEKFIPERFLGIDVDRYAFFPFSSGKNICTGRDLAWVEMILYLAYLFKELDLKTEKVHIPSKAAITIRPLKDLDIKII